MTQFLVITYETVKFKILEFLTPSSATPVCCHPFRPSLSSSGAWHLPSLCVATLLGRLMCTCCHEQPLTGLPHLQPQPTPALCLTRGQLLEEQCLHMLSLRALQTASGNSLQAHSAANGGGWGAAPRRGPVSMSIKNFIFMCLKY